jgi:hypothetical protein
VTLVRLESNRAPAVVATFNAPPKTHTVGIDETRHKLWIVYPAPGGDFIEALRIAP